MSQCSSSSELQQVSLRRAVSMLAGDLKLAGLLPFTSSLLRSLALIRFLLLLLFFNFYNSNLESELAICIRKQSLLWGKGSSKIDNLRQWKCSFFPTFQIILIRRSKHQPLNERVQCELKCPLCFSKWHCPPSPTTCICSETHECW